MPPRWQLRCSGSRAPSTAASFGCGATGWVTSCHVRNLPVPLIHAPRRARTGCRAGCTRFSSAQKRTKGRTASSHRRPPQALVPESGSGACSAIPATPLRVAAASSSSLSKGGGEETRPTVSRFCATTSRRISRYSETSTWSSCQRLFLNRSAASGSMLRAAPRASRSSATSRRSLRDRWSRTTRSLPAPSRCMQPPQIDCVGRRQTWLPTAMAATAARAAPSPGNWSSAKRPSNRGATNVGRRRRKECSYTCTMHRRTRRRVRAAAPHRRGA